MKLHVLGIDLGRRSFIWLGLRRASTLLTQLGEMLRAWGGSLDLLREGVVIGDELGPPTRNVKFGILRKLLKALWRSTLKRRRV
jgi:hypothetical protein